MNERNTRRIVIVGGGRNCGGLSAALTETMAKRLTAEAELKVLRPELEALRKENKQKGNSLKGLEAVQDMLSQSNQKLASENQYLRENMERLEKSIKTNDTKRRK